MNEADLLQNLIQVALSAAAGLLVAGVGTLANAAASKVRNQALAQLMRNTHEAALNVVKALRATREDPRPLSPEQVRRIRQLALRQVKQDLGPQGLKDIRHAVGRDGDLDALLCRHIEAALSDVKNKHRTESTDPTIIEEPPC